METRHLFYFLGVLALTAGVISWHRRVDARAFAAGQASGYLRGIAEAGRIERQHHAYS